MKDKFQGEHEELTISVMRLEKAIMDILHDKLCPEFVRDKLRRALTNQPDVPPLDGCRVGPAA